MKLLASALCLCALLATAACVDHNTQIPPNRVDQGSYIGAPGSGAP